MQPSHFPLTNFAEQTKTSGLCSTVARNLDPRYGGISASLPNLCRQTSLLGWPGQVIVSNDASLSTPCFTKDIDILPIAFSPFSAAKGFLGNRRLRSSLAACDVVHIHGIWNLHCAASGSLARQLGKPYIVSVHGMLENWALRQKRLKKKFYSSIIERANLNGASCLRALTQSEALDYRRFGLKQPVVVIPNGVVPPTSANHCHFLEKFPELQSRQVVLFLGRIHHKKGLDPLLKAWSRVSRDFPNAVLVLAGPDFENTQKSLEILADELGIRQTVVFTGMLGEEMKWGALAAADFFILPSYSEGFSVAILEALALSLPVIISPQCNFPDVAEANCGVIANPDVAAIE